MIFMILGFMGLGILIIGGIIGFILDIINEPEADNWGNDGGGATFVMLIITFPIFMVLIIIGGILEAIL